MKLARTMTALSLIAGVTGWMAARAALQRLERQRRNETAERTRWETDGGATAEGPQTPGASLPR